MRFWTPSPQRFIDGTVGFGHAYAKLQCKRHGSIAWNSGHKAFAKGYATNATNTVKLDFEFTHLTKPIKSQYAAANLNKSIKRKTIQSTSKQLNTIEVESQP